MHTCSMYVCVCNAVTEKAIRQTVADGARSLRELRMRTGCSTTCGKCGPLAREVLYEALAQQEVELDTRPRLRIVSSG